MRVTGMMQNTQLLKNLHNNNRGITDWQNKLGTGQRIHRPGDDPVGIGYLMRYNSELNRSDEFLENARLGMAYLDTMDALMQQVSDVLYRAQRLAQQGGTGTTTEDAREHIAAEVKHLKEQLVQIGNSSFNGRYLFNGQKTDQPPYTVANAANETTDRGVYYLSVSPSVSVPVSVTGEEIFGDAGDPLNAFRVLDNLISGLENNDQDQILAAMADIDACSDRLNTVWAEVGARRNRFELVENRILDNKVSLEKLKSETGDVDMADAIVRLQLKENVLQASLAIGARVMQVSLIDYLR